MKRDNKGFTLIEVLIAVLILAIVIVPLLHSFASSYNVNAKSREILRATTLAQNEMEIFEREKLAVLVDDAEADADAKVYGYDKCVKTSYTATDPVMTGETTEHVAYTFTKTGVINDKTGREMFDVVVKLDPESDPEGLSASDLYYTRNTQELLFMNTLSSLDSAVYVQKVKDKNNVNTTGDDEAVYNIYADRVAVVNPYNTEWTSAKFAAELKRTITVTIEQDDQDGFVTTVVKVNYKYESNCDLLTDESSKVYSVGDKVIFNNAQTLDEEGNPIELQSVYLFYAPRYEAGVVSSPDKENIVIENKDNLPVNVYIIRQNILEDDGSILGVYTDSLGTEWNTVPINYYANIEIHEDLDGGETYGRYFTNLNLELPGTTENGTTKVTLYDSGITGSSFQDDEAIKKAKFRSLGSTESKDRIYTMDVSVYRNGADPDTDDPLVKLTGTKIE